MRPLENLLILRNHFSADTMVETTRNELSEILYCTHRNVNFILKKLAEGQYITWVPGRGRGVYSKILFHQSFYEIAEQYMEEMVHHQAISEILASIESIQLKEKNKTILSQFLHRALQPKVEMTSSGSLKSTISLLLPQQVNTLDPIDVYLYSEAHLIKQIYSTLVFYNDTTKKVEPSLAYGWREHNDGQAWTFYLRKAVYFHDGQLLSAKDVHFTFARIMEVGSESLIKPLLSDLEEVQILNDYTLTFHLKGTNWLFPFVLCSYHCSILTKSHKEGNLNGTGPFRVLHHTDRNIRLEAFDSYFKERAITDQVDIWMTKTPINLIESNQIQLRDNTSEYRKTEDIELTGSRFIVFNASKEGIHNNHFFRKAVRSLYDPVKIVTDLKGNRTLPANSFMPKNSRRHFEWKGSLEKAKQLLDLSGYSGEILTLYYFQLNEGEESALWLVDEAKRIGLNLSLIPMPQNNPKGEELLAHADIVLLSVILQGDYTFSLYSLYKSEYGFLRQFLDHKTLDYINLVLGQLIKKQNAEERLHLLTMIEEYLKEYVCLHFLYHSIIRVEYHSFLHGFSMSSLGLPDFDKIWFDPEYEGQKLDS